MDSPDVSCKLKKKSDMSDKLPFFFFFFQFLKQGVLVLKYQTHSFNWQLYSAVYSTALNYENYEKLLTDKNLSERIAESQLGESSELPVAPPLWRQYFLESVAYKSYASGQRQGMSLKDLHIIYLFLAPPYAQGKASEQSITCTTLPHPPPPTHFIIKILAKLIMP